MGEVRSVWRVLLSRVAVTGMALLAVGLLAGALAVHRVDAPGQVDIDLIRRDGEYAFIPMFAMAASAMYHLVQGGRFDALGIVAGSLEGFALVTRPWHPQKIGFFLAFIRWQNSISRFFEPIMLSSTKAIKST